MLKNSFRSLLIIAATALSSSDAFGQVELQLRVRQLPGWDARSREGRCDIRVWVDNRAEVRMRGDAVFVRTVEGSRGRDEGSQCSHPLPYNSVRAFQIRQTAGRTRIALAEEPSRRNNFTALIEINDSQGGGDNYAFEVTWQAEPNIATAPAPFFDNVRACQDAVRQRFLSQNGRGSYIDFDTFADRRGEDQNRGQGRDAGRNNGPNLSQESIQGRGSARRPNESRDLTYSCVIDMRQHKVLTGTYQYAAAGLRIPRRQNDRSQLR